MAQTAMTVRMDNQQKEVKPQSSRLMKSMKKSEKCNHLYFHTPSEPPLCKGDSRDVKNKK